MNQLKEIPLNQLKTKSNYRKTFHEKSLKELADSIKENGVIEPIIIQPNGDGFYIIAGERRVRAAHIAKLATIPAIIKEIDDKDFFKIQLIENIQREGVAYMEEAYGLRELRDSCDLDLQEIARMIGKSDTYVHSVIGLTKMSNAAQEAARNGEISKSVAIHIARLPNTDYQNRMARDLRRTRKDQLITESTARKYIQEHFADTRLCVPRKSKLEKLPGSDYAANWKKYLVNFSCEQFENFKAIVRGRIDTQTLSEAVDLVMRKTEK